MKLGLLAVVAVAVLLLKFSESRIVSRCELRDQLGKMIDLRRRLWERVLATVICELELRSDLNTTLVESFGMCIPTITNTTMVTDLNTTGVNEMTTGAATLANTNLTNNDLTNTTAAADTSTINSLNTTFVSNSTSGIKRRRRDADSNSDEENTFSEEEQEDASKMEDEDEMGNEEKNRFSEEEYEEDSEMQDEDEMRSEEDAESQNLYGLFQLSDRQFCDSGLCPSENMCQTWCTAFTDDDITDDIACVIDTGYWREIMSTASESCRRTWNFFEDCN